MMHSLSKILNLSYFLAEKYLNRVGLIFHREDNQVPDDTTLVTAIAKVIPRRSINPNLLPHLQSLEAAFRFLPPLFSLAKSLLILFGFSKSRRILRAALTRIIRLRHSKKRHLSVVRRPSDIQLLAKQKPAEVEKPTANSNHNHIDHIPISVLTNNSHPRVDPKTRVYRYQDEEIEEFSV